jgi:hypothetical protein
VIGRSKVNVPAPQRDALIEAEPDNPKDDVAATFAAE